MSGFKNNSLIISQCNMAITPSISGDVSVRVTSGRLRVWDGNNEFTVPWASDDVAAHASTHIGGSDSIAWETIHGRGTLASRSLASPSNQGFFYETTDITGRTLTRSDGFNWNELPVVFRDRTAINIKDFGAVGDGVVDDSAAFTSAIAATPTGGEMIFPPGTYRLAARIVVNRPIKIRGAGKNATTLLVDTFVTTLPFSVNPIIKVTAYPASIEDLTMDLQYPEPGTSGTGSKIGYPAITADHTEGFSLIRCCIKRFSKVGVAAGWAVAFGTIYTDNTSTTKGNILIDDCDFEDATTWGGITFWTLSDCESNPDYGMRNIKIRNCRFTDVGGTMISNQGQNLTPFSANRHSLQELTIEGCQFRGNGLGFYGDMVTEIFGIDNLVFQYNQIYEAWRGLGVYEAEGFSVLGNLFRDQKNIACEFGGNNGQFYANVCLDCGCFLQDTGGVSHNISVVANHIEGGHPLMDRIRVAIAPAADSVDLGASTGWVITDNVFYDYPGFRVIETPRLASGYIISDNQFFVSDPSGTMTFIMARGAKMKIENNKGMITADLSGASFTTFHTCIQYDHVNCSDISINENKFDFYGEISPGYGIVAMGAFNNIPPEQYTPGVSICGNRIRGNFSTGIYVRFVDENSRVIGNDTALCEGDDYFGEGLVHRDDIEQSSGTSLPDTGVWVRGTIYRNKNPSVNGIEYWTCLTTGDYAGTPPTWHATYLRDFDGVVGNTITYNGEGKLYSITTSFGTKTMTYNPDGTLASVTGTGSYKSKSFTYVNGKLTGVNVL